MARREETGLKFASALPLSETERACSAEAERAKLYDRARLWSIRAAAVIDIRHYLRRPTKAEIALSRRRVGEVSE